jgi:hypothetical protein
MTLLGVLLALALLAAAGRPLQAALARVEAFGLSWWTVDGGGTAGLEAGGYHLAGTAGQPEAGSLSAGGYTLYGGYWGPANPQPAGYQLFLPITLK